MSYGTLDTARLFLDFVYEAFTLFGQLSQNCSTIRHSHVAVLTPEYMYSGLGSYHFARRYFGNRFFFLFLRVLRCFSSPGSQHNTMDSCYVDGGLLRQVSPFRNHWIKGYLLLPNAYRSLSRLSSALSAKASTLRSY